MQRTRRGAAALIALSRCLVQSHASRIYLGDKVDARDGGIFCGNKLDWHRRLIIMVSLIHNDRRGQSNCVCACRRLLCSRCHSMLKINHECLHTGLATTLRPPIGYRSQETNNDLINTKHSQRCFETESDSCSHQKDHTNKNEVDSLFARNESAVSTLGPLRRIEVRKRDPPQKETPQRKILRCYTTTWPMRT
jgi:hypothetical protein